ncbi:MAG: ferrous iron transport protein A [Pirellulales bacterium]|nr:ferrous iron transport protein A [Pirellulales bacterium]
MSEIIPLSMVRSGHSATVDQVVGKPEQVQRLEELGIRAGETIEVVQAGSPCILKLGTKRLCFREADLLQVLVTTGVSA